MPAVLMSYSKKSQACDLSLSAEILVEQFLVNSLQGFFVGGEGVVAEHGIEGWS
jgi:hypothetical protein